MAKAVSKDIYQLKVTLAVVRPAVWRRVLVPSSLRLRDLHDILQIVMGWTDSHLHQFEAKGQLYGTPDPDFPVPIKSEGRAQLNDILAREKDWMLYEYDFGDGWVHKIVLEKIIPASSKLKVPSCAAGARACPPEDCGGPYGYAEFRKAIRDPSHPEHEDMLEWIGDEFDSDYFDLEHVNRQLAPFRSGL